MASTAQRVAKATELGANAALLEIADIIVSMHAIEERAAGSVLPISSMYDRHSDRAKILVELAKEIQKLCVELKLEPPPALNRITRPR